MVQQELTQEVEELKDRVATLERVMGMLMEVEEVSPENLTKRDRAHLERTSRYLREGRSNKFVTLEEFQKRLGL